LKLDNAAYWALYVMVKV